MAVRLGMPAATRRFTVERIVSAYYAGEWQEALTLSDDYLGAIDAGSPHFGEVDARIARARIRRANGDRAGAMRDARAALEYARHSSRSLISYRRRSPRGFRRAEDPMDRRPVPASSSTACAQDRSCGRVTLPDVLPAIVDLEQADVLQQILADALPSTEWYAAAEAFLNADYATCAGVYGRIGSHPDQADAQLMWSRRPARRTRSTRWRQVSRRRLSSIAPSVRRPGCRKSRRFEGRLAVGSTLRRSATR